MKLYNNRITRKWNKFLREVFILPYMRKRLKNDQFTLIANNCNGGFIMHDLGLQFKTPTVNLSFFGTCFFDFVENMEYYLSHEVISAGESDEGYPIGIIKGNGKVPDVCLHFMHYKTFQEAKIKWDSRTKRVNKKNIFVMWTFFGDTWEETFDRIEEWPVKNKVAFVNKDYGAQYPSLYYIKGFEKEKGLGQLSEYQNLLGKRYYDSFDYVKWFNTGEW